MLGLSCLAGAATTSGAKVICFIAASIGAGVRGCVIVVIFRPASAVFSAIKILGTLEILCAFLGTEGFGTGFDADAGVAIVGVATTFFTESHFILRRLGISLFLWFGEWASIGRMGFRRV